MSWLPYLLFLVVIIVVIKKSNKKNQQSSGVATAEATAIEDTVATLDVAELPYRKLDLLFTKAERSFLGILNQALANEVEIFGKVRVADVLDVEAGLTPSDKQIAFNKISAKHFDFVLCDKKTLGILCVIELDDRSHNSKKRQQRDAFLVKACESAKMPFFQFKAKRNYGIHDVRLALVDILPNESNNKITSNEPGVAVEITPETALGKKLVQAAEQSSSSNQKVCPKCASNMVLRVAGKGKNKGESFWGCTTFPNCRYMQPEDNSDDALFEH